ncbi:hypothetical protein GCM10027072_46730 [Streptomyces bullii]
MVTFLHEWRLNPLPPDTRPSMTPYAQLLRGRRASRGEQRQSSTVALPRQRGLTERAATAAIDTQLCGGCAFSTRSVAVRRWAAASATFMRPTPTSYRVHERSHRDGCQLAG